MEDKRPDPGKDQITRDLLDLMRVWSFSPKSTGKSMEGFKWRQDRMKLLFGRNILQQLLKVWS